MKKNRFIPAVAALGAAALLAGCAFEGTDLSEKKTEVASYNATAVENRKANSGTKGTLAVSGTATLGVADNVVKVTVTSATGIKIDLDTFASAVSFKGIADSGSDYRAYNLTAAYPATLKDTTVNGASVTGTYVLDLASAGQTTVVVDVDAAVLKDKAGNFALNGNGNSVLGETTDTLRTTLAAGVGKVVSVSIKGTGVPEVAPVLTSLGTPTSRYITNTDGDTTGYYFTLAAPEVDANTTGKVYATTLNLASKYQLQVLAPGATEWTDVALTWSYKETADTSVNTRWAAHDYYAEITTAYDEGTKYRWVTTVSPELKLTVYGVETPETYITEAVKTAGTAATLNGKIDTTVIHNVTQTGLFTVTRTSKVASEGAQFLVTLNADTLLAAAAPVGTHNTLTATGFKVIATTYDVEVESTVTKLNDTTYLVVTNDNTFKTTDLDLYAGADVAIQTNAAKPSQVKFGAPADAEKGKASGLVKIN